VPKRWKPELSTRRVRRHRTQSNHVHSEGDKCIIVVDTDTDREVYTLSFDTYRWYCARVDGVDYEQKVIWSRGACCTKIFCKIIFVFKFPPRNAWFQSSPNGSNESTLPLRHGAFAYMTSIYSLMVFLWCNSANTGVHKMSTQSVGHVNPVLIHSRPTQELVQGVHRAFLSKTKSSWNRTDNWH